MNTKLCNVCKTEKPVSEFYKKGSGYQYRCKKCRKVFDKTSRYDTCVCGKRKLQTSTACVVCRGLNSRETYPQTLIDQVVSLYNGGASTWKIADVLKCNQMRIRRILGRNGILLRENTFINTGRNKIRENNPSWTGYKGISGGLWGSIIRAAQVRGLVFELSKEYIWNLFIEQDNQCALSGLKIILPKSDEERITGYATASLDRINNSIGYIVGNVQWVHKFVNRMKSNYTEEEFFYLCHLVASKNKTKLNKRTRLTTLLSRHRKQKCHV